MCCDWLLVSTSDLAIMFFVENKTELSDEGKMLSRLLETASVPARERTQQCKDSPASCLYSLDLSVLYNFLFCVAVQIKMNSCFVIC